MVRGQTKVPVSRRTIRANREISAIWENRSLSHELFINGSQPAPARESAGESAGGPAFARMTSRLRSPGLAAFSTAVLSPQNLGTWLPHRPRVSYLPDTDSAKNRKPLDEEQNTTTVIAFLAVRSLIAGCYESSNIQPNFRPAAAYRTDPLTEVLMTAT